MLVLRRSSGQTVVIGENAEIIVKVLRNENGVVSIGFDAPTVVQINRLESYEKTLVSSNLPSDRKFNLINRLSQFDQKSKKFRDNCAN